MAFESMIFGTHTSSRFNVRHGYQTFCGRPSKGPYKTTKRLQRTNKAIVKSDYAVAVHSRRFFGDPALLSGTVSRTLRKRYARSGVVVHALFEKFTERSIRSVMLGQGFCREMECREMGQEHLLLGMIAEADTGEGYFESGVDIELGFSVLGKRRRALPPDSLGADSLPFTPGAKVVFEGALMESRRMGMTFISPEHILLSILENKNDAVRKILKLIGIGDGALKVEALRRLRNESQEMVQRQKEAVASGAGAKHGKKSDQDVLNEYCKDLNKEARMKRIDPIIGRKKEVQRVAQILSRRSKNNAILLGDPGVGKTAIAEGLACAIESKCLPDGSPLPAFLEKKRLFQLDIPLLIAGAKERGELESRITKILRACQEDGNIILVMDEIHCMVGGGSSGRGRGVAGSSDMGNLFKPALARGEIQCIGATTVDEHRKYVESDSALERRFQPVYVEEPTEEETLKILHGLAGLYEKHHQCIYSEEAIHAAVKLSSRYIADRKLPDKAIDVLDEAGSRVRIRAYASRVMGDIHLSDVDMAAYKELLQVIDAKEEAVRDMLYEEASLLRSREIGLKTTLGGPAEDGAVIPVVDIDEIQSVVSSWSGVPVKSLEDTGTEKLLNLEENIRMRVIGQDMAVRVASNAIARAAAGIGNPKRPIATLLFSGPTGVGKTELAKAIAEQYFSGSIRDSSMIRLDMSEYMERHTVSKLIGSPPGYVGYNEGGKLTEAIRRNPHSLVLFDEIEKAHPDVFNMLLQMVEDGRLTDSHGRVVSFSNALIILTSNVGSSVISKGGEAGIGFNLGGHDKQTRHEKLKSLVMEELKNYFRPELLNRMDEIVVFQKLDKDTLLAIAKNEVQKTVEMAKNCGIELEIEDHVYATIVAEGYSEEMGAREIRRSVTSMIENPLSDIILELQSGDACTNKFRVCCKADDKIEIVASTEEEILRETINVSSRVAHA